MITHKEVIRAISNLHLMAVDDRIELVRRFIDDDLRVALNYVQEQRTQQEKVSKLLGLCLKFIEGLNITIETTTDESDTYDYEYLEIGFAKCELLPIFNQIQALKEELK